MRVFVFVISLILSVIPYHAEAQERGSIGAELIKQNNVRIKVGRLRINGPAHRAGLRTGDIISGYDDSHFLKYDEFVQYLTGKKPGDIIELSVRYADSGPRGGRIKIRLDRSPETYEIAEILREQTKIVRAEEARREQSAEILEEYNWNLYKYSGGRNNDQILVFDATQTFALYSYSNYGRSVCQPLNKGVNDGKQSIDVNLLVRIGPDDRILPTEESRYNFISHYWSLLKKECPTLLRVNLIGYVEGAVFNDNGVQFASNLNRDQLNLSSTRPNFEALFYHKKHYNNYRGEDAPPNNSTKSWLQSSGESAYVPADATFAEYAKRLEGYKNQSRAIARSWHCADHDDLRNASYNRYSNPATARRYNLSCFSTGRPSFASDFKYSAFRMSMDSVYELMAKNSRNAFTYQDALLYWKAHESAFPSCAADLEIYSWKVVNTTTSLLLGTHQTSYNNSVRAKPKYKKIVMAGRYSNYAMVNFFKEWLPRFKGCNDPALLEFEEKFHASLR